MATRITEGGGRGGAAGSMGSKIKTKAAVKAATKKKPLTEPKSAVRVKRKDSDLGRRVDNRVETKRVNNAKSGVTASQDAAAVQVRLRPRKIIKIK